MHRFLTDVKHEMKRLYILFWWYILIGQDDQDESLTFRPMRSELDQKKILARRRIAYDLKRGYSIWNIAPYLIDEF